MTSPSDLHHCKWCYVGDHGLCLGNLGLPSSVRQWCECPSPRCAIDRLPHKWMRDRLVKMDGALNRDDEQARELIKALREWLHGVRPLCVGCEQVVDITVDDGSWSDVGIGDYNHRGCGPWTRRGDADGAGS